MNAPKSRQLPEPLAQLLRHPQLWRAGQLGAAPESVSSGFAALDVHLPGGGWPRAGLMELLLATAGVGELRLLLPALQALSREQNRRIVWIAPPFIPYAPALEAGGVDVGSLLVVQPDSHQEALWALERASRCGACSLALAWLDERQLTLTDTRRLQLAARHGRTLTCLFRPEKAAAASSLAELRLRLTTVGAGTLTVDICKRHGGWPVSGISVDIGTPPAPDDIHRQLALWRQWHQQSAAQAPAMFRHDETPEQQRRRLEGAPLSAGGARGVVH